MHTVLLRCFAIVFLGITLQANAQISGFTERSGLNPELEPFYHGVASGDPSQNGVIIWTRVTPRDANPVEVLWRIALDTTFSNTIRSGAVTTNESKDWTVKVDVSGLQPNTWYYYEFNAYGKNSLIGRTKTAPDGTISQLRFATVSCSNYNAGFFNVYDQIFKRNDIDAILHLGDYIYEYGSSGIRSADPDKEIIELADYRIRHSVHKLDPMSIRMHQQYPLISTWDDHEVANDAWRNGADNHDASEGPYELRKSAAAQSYDEWMPTRLQEPDKPSKLWRKISYGGLADIFMLDTRHYDRDIQDASKVDDPTRGMLGAEQLAWLEAELKSSTAQWKILAQQVMMGPLTPFGLTINPDQWDGYTAERKRLYDIILNNNIQNVVVLTGDIHTAWAQDLPYEQSQYAPVGGGGSVAVEFVCTSVSSNSSPIAIPQWLYGIVTGVLPHIKYVDLFRKGYSLLDLSAQKAANHFYTIKTVSKEDEFERLEQVWFVNNGGRSLKKQPNAETMQAAPQYQAPPLPRTSTITPVNEQVNAVIVASYPNPFVNSFQVQFNLFQPAKTVMNIYSTNGQLIWSKNLGTLTQGLHIQNIEAGNFPNGQYRMVIEADGAIYEKPIVKM